MWSLDQQHTTHLGNLFETQILGTHSRPYVVCLKLYSFNFLHVGL